MVFETSKRILETANELMKSKANSIKKKLTYFFSRFCMPIFCLLGLIIFNVCQKTHNDIQVEYLDETGQSLTAIYHNPVSEGIFSVTLRMNDRNEVNLEQGEAASGARYTDQKTLVWWTKGESAFIMKPDKIGEWQIVGRFREKPDSR